MIFVFTILIYVFEFLAITLLAFLAYRYRANIASIRVSGPKATWSRLFTLFIVSALLTESLTWTQGYIKCLDTSDELERLMGLEASRYLCQQWDSFDRRAKLALFTLYLICEFIAVCAFQALVLERYRKVSILFPRWTSKHALPIYTALYIPIGMAACLLSLLEFWTSPKTLISREATINTISSAVYCLWIVLTGLTDAVLSFLIVTKVRRGRREYQAHQAGAAEENGMDDMALRNSLPRDAQFKPLRRLQIFFATIILFDFSILSLTVLKKLDGHGVDGHVFAYEVASIEIALTLVHCTMTLCFMQFLGSILRTTQPQFEFVLGSQESSTQVVNQTVFTTGPVTFSWTSKQSDEETTKKTLGVPIYTQREIAPDDISIPDLDNGEEEIQVVHPGFGSDTKTITTIL
ncbi:protein of unknown function [Taphrina deformans PYCC 5710]|uniref:Uncharacterized protein n=1 Tax=Taphrina deformans (strain PYCC 5710 / ATCC 11124 / CBS 356.35 / IMI 108563 / JCM 9778 / NBRC 8474) TaxID=1097556 RepID=R4XKV9_TAPDE|nr:protein of unknown function [Taphrina deformans PYCC 5710]|eukprot:CCG85054.1 protein of unknown function [Taphrina deformans PYCC 5710]